MDVGGWKGVDGNVVSFDAIRQEAYTTTGWIGMSNDNNL